MLVSQSEPRIDTYHRHGDGGWSFGPYAGVDSAAKLLSLKIELPLAEIYSGVEIPRL